MGGATESPRALTLGTAGHIDHGKSALVRALTGVDPDRLPEEKARGITIELGFAPLDLGDGLRLGVVDVPGHERLVRTMVAGALGIDLVLLVVAADEGVMPQTREHLAVCELIGLERGVVALTKIDAVPGELCELAEEEVREHLAGGALAGAPIVRVSARSGEGLEALRTALRAAAAEAASRPRAEAPPRLAVDRIFSVRGFGAVVTGTLAGAPLAVGEPVEILPGARPARIRGLQHFGEPRESVAPGARCAVNLQGAAREEIRRGDVVTRPGALAPTLCFDAALRWLPGSPPLGRDPRAVELLVGTAERRARVAPIGADAVGPGEVALARLHVDGAPLALLPGDPFVLRGFARTADGGATLGGGSVLDVAPPRRRRSDPALAAELVALQGGDLGEGLIRRVLRAGFEGVARHDLARQMGARAERVDALLAADTLGRTARAGDLWIGRSRLEELERRLLAALQAFHQSEPLRPGMPRGALRGALPENTPAEAAELALERLAAAGKLELEAEQARSAGFEPRLSSRQQRLAELLEAGSRAAGLEPPSLREWSARLETEEAELRDLLAHLERRGALVRAPGERWFDRAAVDALRGRLVTALRERGSLDTAACKELIGTSRKWAVPLLELFDSEHLTVRRGEVRVLRRG